MPAARSAERTEFLTDVFTTAMEGGVSYWASVLEYRHTESPRAVLVRIEDLVPDEETMSWVPGQGAEELIVDLDVLARGIDRIGKGPIEYLPVSHRPLVAAASRENDMMPAHARHGDIDAGVADNIVQAALFGKIVYG
ncbi:hypothetical protein SIM91_05005 [Rhodococcus opacus]|uniref:hypothetical protein n=1 Tax=Rhodococcus opacus TaxID=37919 RepID=UPI0002A1F8E4|nr:hypothetical protein [Rhodococcus opacus]ELB88168.1 hypothetical protein Rwratislav_36074 [Rhodococcus wratislaviensis IFP 2016]MDX5962682.1 hypothetical protein [Rhodococcus opacus]CAG7636401.1 hypothetical protein E143388_07791 [Rhodococcus opacus]